MTSKFNAEFAVEEENVKIMVATKCSVKLSELSEFISSIIIDNISTFVGAHGLKNVVVVFTNKDGKVRNFESGSHRSQWFNPTVLLDDLAAQLEI